MHPAHVPLVAEAQPALIDGARHLRPGGRLLGDGDDAGMGAVGARVEGLEEGDGFQVLAAAMDVGDPLARRPAVVEVEHGGDRIDPEPVDVIAVEPEQRVGERGSWPPRGGRSCRSACPSRGGTLAAGPRARRAPCRRSAPGRAGRSGSAPAPSRCSTPMPAWWQRSTKRAKASGGPKRAVGAKRPTGW